MKRRYLGLLVSMLVIGAALSLWGGPARSGKRSAPSPAGPASPVAAIALRVERGGAMSPPSVVVEKDRRVAISVTNLRDVAIRVELPGYDDRLSPVRLEPGATWRGELVADRPGEDFAWLVDGKPAGRFVVTGAHLIEGHR